MMAAAPGRKAIVFIAVTLLLDTIGFGLIIPVLPRLLVSITGASVSRAAIFGGWLAFLYAAMQFLCAPVLGGLSDRFGRRPVLLGCSAATAPLILVFVIVGGVPGAIALAGVGISVIATFGVTMVMSQEYLPRHIGMASGLSIGLSIGLGGVGAVALGAVADSIDLRAAMYVAAGAALVALVLAALLPSSRPSRQLAVEPVAP